jgi:hypothetical protein
VWNSLTKYQRGVYNAFVSYIKIESNNPKRLKKIFNEFLIKILFIHSINILSTHLTEIWSFIIFALYIDVCIHHLYSIHPRVYISTIKGVYWPSNAHFWSLILHLFHHQHNIFQLLLAIIRHILYKEVKNWAMYKDHLCQLKLIT